MGRHYLTFMRRNFENKKKLTFLRIMNSVGLSDKDIVNSVNIFSDIFVVDINYRN